MKKIIAASAALALAAFAFADGAAPAAPAPAFTLNGAIYTGIQLTGGDSAKTGAAKLWSDTKSKASRFDLDGAYKNGDMGANFRLREETLTGAPTFKYAYVWANYLNNFVTIKAGNVDDGSWKTEGDTGFEASSGTGAQFSVIPLAGLNVGVKANVFTAQNGSALTTQQFLNELAFGTNYKSDLFNFQAGYKLDSNADDNKATSTTTYSLTPVSGSTTDYTVKTSTATVYDDTNAKKHDYLYFGVNYKGVKGLTAIGEAQFNNLGKYSDIGTATIDETFAYAVTDPITVNLLAYQKLSSVTGAKPLFNFKPGVDYKLDAMTTLNGRVFYEINSGNVKDVSTLYVQPGATFTIGKAALQSFYRYTISDINKKASANAKRYADHMLQLDLVWKF